MDLKQTLTEARESGDYSAFLASIPYGEYMGYVARVVDGVVRLELPFQDKFIGNPNLPSLHGGVVGATLEMAALVQLLHSARSEHIPRTIDFTIDYLRQSKPAPLYAEAEVLREGRRVANARMVVFQDDRTKPVASGRGNFLMI